MSDWKRDKAWADRFNNQIVEILEPRVREKMTIEIRPADAADDALRNTDFVLVAQSGLRVSCRVREPAAYMAWPDEFTIRSRRPSGNTTELEKIYLWGWGDLFFYGFAAEDRMTLRAWMVADLGVFRRWYRKERWEKKTRFREIWNRNRDSQFTVFSASQIANSDPAFIVASHGLPVSQRAA